MSASSTSSLKLSPPLPKAPLRERILNKDLLLEICDRISKQPERFTMLSWRRNGPCGTTMCIAGWAMHLAGYDCMADYAGWLAGDVLGLSSAQEPRLFFAVHWPAPFFHRYLIAKTPEERAAAAVMRIHHFIDTGE